MAKTYIQVKGTIEEQSYKDKLENFLSTNGSDVTEETKEQIRKNPDHFVLFADSEDGLEVTFKDPTSIY